MSIAKSVNRHRLCSTYEAQRLCSTYEAQRLCSTYEAQRLCSTYEAQRLCSTYEAFPTHMALILAFTFGRYKLMIFLLSKMKCRIS